MQEFVGVCLCGVCVVCINTLQIWATMICIRYMYHLDKQSHRLTFNILHLVFQFKRIWTEVRRKHLLHESSEVESALKQCIETCGTCQEGMQSLWY